MPGYVTVCVDIQHVFAGTLDVAVGTQPKRLCLRKYNMCLWMHNILSYLDLLQSEIIFVLPPLTTNQS